MIQAFYIIFLSFFVSNSLIAGDGIDCTSNESIDASKKIITLNSNVVKIVEKMNSQDLKNYEEADAFLQTINKATDFNDDLVLIEINKVKPICLNKNNEKIFLSKACTTLSRLHGKIAYKNKMNGLNDGKLFFKYVKKALQINPQNSDAALAYAKGVYGGHDQLSSTIVATALDINLEDETKNAIKAIEATNQTSSSFYELLKDELD